jgi:tRNA A58 N-methylase Trm61
MPIDLEQLRSIEATVTDCGEFAELETREEVLAYLIAVSRAEGWDEVEMVEIVARAAKMSRDELRYVRDVLKRLGYVAVASMLTELARKAKRTLKTNHLT